MLLGIPLHVAFAYTAIEYQWLIKDADHSPFVDMGLYFLRVFRMPLFFIISGFFAHYVMRKNSSTFLVERFKRLFIPLMILFILIICPMRVIWLFGEVISRPEAFKFEVFKDFVVQNFFVSTTSRLNIPASWGHLWFLLYLFLFSLASYYLSFLNPKIKSIRPNVLVLMVLTFLSYFLMEGTWVDLPFGIIPKISLFFYYGLFYYYGWNSLRHLQNDQSHSFRLSCSILIIGLIAGMARAYFEVNSQLDLSSTTLPRVFLFAIGTVATWFISLGLIYTMKELVQKERRTMTFFVRASYSIYLIHLPIIVILQLLFFQINAHWSLKIFFLSVLTLSISSLIYRFLIQDKWPERFLRGDYKLSGSSRDTSLKA